MKSEYILKLAEVFLEASRNDYMREYMKNRYHSKRDGVIALLGGKCVNCGSKKDLHIDHIDKKKKTFRAADIHSVSDDKVKKELKNLQLLCRDCHKKKTKEAWDFSTPKPQHGTYWTYRKHKCRCDKCVAAYKEKVKEWRKKKIV